MKTMSLYSLTLHFRLGTVAGTTTYLARGRSLAEAKRFARAKFRTLNPEAILSRIVHDADATDHANKIHTARKSLGLRYTR
jgi:hypothetical protein